MAEAIRTDELTKHYGRTVALDSLDLTVDSGEVFGYLGPNGAGRSTTIGLLLGLTRPTSGTATIFGLDVWRNAPEVHRRLAMSPVKRICGLRSRVPRPWNSSPTRLGSTR